MSVKAMAWAWEIEDLPVYEKLVLLYLAHRAGVSNRCWPGKETIAAACGCSKRKVDYSLKALADQGMIRICHRQSDRGNITNVYCVEVPENT